MSKQTWATIVYGRSYHLDFRFITVPNDFTATEIAWASPYILATTQQARNLTSSPRWSLFKNNTHCVIGVTCMVRDLMGKLGQNSIEVMAKDEHGRPLYVFVGYVTQLNHGLGLTDFPAYTETYLISFKHLYRAIEKVWLTRDYDNRKPFLSEYKPLDKRVHTANLTLNTEGMSRLNNMTRYPQKTFVWEQSVRQNRQLWLASAQCLDPTSVCLDIKGQQLANSPFLNQTITKTSNFTVSDRLAEFSPARKSSPKAHQPSTIKQKISTRAKEDINITLQQAAKVTSASQGIIDNLTGNINKVVTEESDSSLDSENFGLKAKKRKSTPSPNNKNWF